MKSRLLLVVVWAFALVAGAVVTSMAPDIRSPGGGGDLLDLIFGEARTALGNQMIERADLYFHGGVGHQDDESEGHMMAQAVQGTGEDRADPRGRGYVELGDDGRDPKEHAGRAGSDWWTWLNRQIRPQDHRHLSGRRYEKEILPWVWAAARCDPHNISAYEVGAYWLTRRLGRAQEGIDFIEEGIANNPGSFELELTRGQILLHTLEQPEAAFDAFLKAERKWKKARHEDAPHPDEGTYGNILLYLALLSEKRGELAQAREYYQAALPLMDNAEQIAARIAALDRRLAGETRAGSGAGVRTPEAGPAE